MPTARDGVWVAVQLALFGLLFFTPPGPTLGLPPVSIYIGIAVIILGSAVAGASFFNLGDSLTPWPTPRPTTLKTDSLYQYVRHPMYTGALLLFSGITLLFDGLYKLPVLIAIAVLLNAKARYEERLLAAAFPEYRKYAERTPRWLPRPWQRHRRIRRQS